MVLILASAFNMGHLDFNMGPLNKYKNPCSHQAKVAMHLLSDLYVIH